MTTDPRRSADPLRELVEVVDRLVSPGGCPWDARQTHESLRPFLVEEAYEVVGRGPALDDPAGDAHLAEELGDLLLQVVFHARIAAGRGAFDIDGVARGITEKLVRRHPHVFSGARLEDADEVEATWETLKAAEKPGRGPLDGIPATLPALARAQKVLGRLQRAGLPGSGMPPDRPPQDDAEAIGSSLLGLVAAARERGVDAEQALRDRLRMVETSAIERPAVGRDA